MAAHTHTPDRNHIGSSTRRADGSFVMYGTCTHCDKAVRRVQGFGIPSETNPNPWAVADSDGLIPLADIRPVPEAGVTTTQSEALPEHVGWQVRFRDGEAWQTIAAATQEVRWHGPIALTASDGKLNFVPAGRTVQIRR